MRTLGKERGRQSLLIATAAAVGGLLLGYDTAVISGAILFVREQFHLDTVQTEVAVSTVLAGALVGAAVGGYLGDRYGRRTLQMLNALLFGLFAVATGMANGLSVFIAARFFVGFAVGISCIITPLYIAEISPANVRGALVTLNQLAMAVGIAAAYYVAYLFAGSGNWRAMFIGALGPSVILLLSLIFLPESPRWLAAHGRFDQARQVLSRVMGSLEAERNFQELTKILEIDKLRFRDLFAPRFRKPIIIGIGLAVFQQITGINTIIYYTPMIMLMAGFNSASSALLTTVLIGSLNVIFGIAALLLMDRVGRRRLLLVSTSAMALTLVHLGYSFGIAHVSRVIVFVDFLVYLASFQLGLGPVFWLMISEIYPTTIRGQAMSLATCVIWAVDLLVTLTFLSLIENFGTRHTFWLYAAACGASTLFTLRLVPETKGRTLEQIESSW